MIDFLSGKQWRSCCTGYTANLYCVVCGAVPHFCTSMPTMWAEQMAWSCRNHTVSPMLYRVFSVMYSSLVILWLGVYPPTSRLPHTRP